MYPLKICDSQDYSMISFKIYPRYSKFASYKENNFFFLHEDEMHLELANFRRSLCQMH